jgi:Domain of unknown function (DUF1704)
MVYDENFFEQIIYTGAQYRRRFTVGNQKEMLASFRSGNFTTPASYKFIHDTYYDAKVLRLQKLGDIIDTSTTHDVVKDLYQHKITEKLDLLNLVKTAALVHGGAHHNSEKFTELTEQIFGAPQTNIFNDIVNKMNNKLHLCQSVTEDTLRYKKLLDETFVSADSESDVLPFVLQKPADIAGSYIYKDAAMVCSYLNANLQDHGIFHWSVVASAKIRHIHVLPNKKVIKIPESKVLGSRKYGRELTRFNLDGLFAHEVLTHVVRHEHGLVSPLKLLAVGLPYYSRGEEGLASYREQLVAGATDYAGFNTYLATGLAYGLDRHGSRRSVQEVFDILTAYFIVCFAATWKQATNKAFALCSQVFVFTDDNKQPLILTAYNVYREGNILIHKLAAEQGLDDTQLNVGKYDPCNSWHVESLRTLGILS